MNDILAKLRGEAADALEGLVVRFQHSVGYSFFGAVVGGVLFGTALAALLIWAASMNAG